ncbi:hypothetical protein NC653_019425 [Populus alba x Populus x berolinensis]|uniref:Uncharacterized protein n=1 Tax=Populus alba x Populus x berolinensis TaxID=444605 RepID=A0AAD6QIW0_9ROSI|nr:hypothetical protein NC653_019425 [Populus alba x Populus x berolinensis]
MRMVKRVLDAWGCFGILDEFVLVVIFPAKSNQWMAIDPLKVLLAAQFMAELILASEF